MFDYAKKDVHFVRRHSISYLLVRHGTAGARGLFLCTGNYYRSRCASNDGPEGIPKYRAELRRNGDSLTDANVLSSFVAAARKRGCPCRQAMDVSV